MPPPPLQPPLVVQELNSSYRVIDAKGVALAYCYWNDNPASVGRHMSKAQACRLAFQIAKLPALIAASER